MTRLQTALVGYAIGFLLSVSSVFAASFFDEWRFPDDADITYDWEIYRQDGSEFFTVTEDFNGDHKQDEAWFLIKNDDSEWGLFVFLDAHSKDPEIVELDRTKMSECPPQCMGIALAPWGYQVTLCGKDYFECDLSEPKIINLKLPAIDYFRFESANSYFAWNKELDSFERIWISD